MSFRDQVLYGIDFGEIDCTGVVVVGCVGTAEMTIRLLELDERLNDFAKDVEEFKLSVRDWYGTERGSDPSVPRRLECRILPKDPPTQPKPPPPHSQGRPPRSSLPARFGTYQGAF